jgi:hypothetical protein
MSGVRNIDTLFFMLMWDWYGFHQNHVRTRYTELVFLHPMGFAGYVVHSSASGAQSVDTLFFMIGSDRYGLTKSALGHVTSNVCFFIR